MYSYIISIIMIFGELVFLFFFIWDYCMCLLKFIVDIFWDMLDFLILKDLFFVFICIGNLFVMIGFYVLFIYLVDYVME